jgi:ankyrin repeat protein
MESNASFPRKWESSTPARGSRAARIFAAAAMLAAMASRVHAQDSNEQQLLQLASEGETQAALALVSPGVDVNQSQSDGTTALHWAIYYNDADLVQRLIERGADVKARNSYGATPLSQAAIVGNTAVIKALLDAGSEADERGADDQTALMIIARTPNVAAAKVLVEAGADVNVREKWRGQTALMWAAAQNQSGMVDFLIAQGADVDAQSLPNNWERQVSAEPRMKILPPGGMTPLLYATREGCTACVASLIKAGANINKADPEGVTPLVMAGLNARWDSMKLLLEAGANPDKWDIYGRNPLYTVVDYSTLPHGGRADRLSSDLTTPIEVAELILARGGNVNLQLKLFPPYRALGPDRGADGLLRTGVTSLFRAARGGDIPMMELLIKHGALIELPSEDGITPLIVAAGFRQAAIDTRGRFRNEAQSLASVRLLLDAGADPNLPENNGQTAIFGAATQGWNSVVQLLAERGANLQHKDVNGNTPLDAAMGRAGVFGRGSGGDPHPETAALIEKLIAERSAN